MLAHFGLGICIFKITLKMTTHLGNISCRTNLTLEIEVISKSFRMEGVIPAYWPRSYTVASKWATFNSTRFNMFAFATKPSFSSNSVT